MPVIKMKKLTAITLSEYEDELVFQLGRTGAVDLRPLREEEVVGFRRPAATELKRCEDLISRLDALCRRQGLPEPLPKRVSDIRRLDEVEERISWYEREFDRMDGMLEEATGRRFLLILRKHGVEPEHVREMKFTFVTAGLLDREAAEKLRLRAKWLPIDVRMEPISEEEYLIICGCLIEHKDALMKFLNNFGFRELRFPEKIPEEVMVPENMVEEKLKEVEKDIKAIKAERNSLIERLRLEAPEIKGVLVALRKINEIKGQLLGSKFMSMVEGWVPYSKLDEVRGVLEKLKEKWGGKLVVSIDDPSPGEKVPAILKNPRIFKAYEGLIRQYGIPGAHDIDPTIVSGVLWTIMFGLMFPDLGQGIALIALGALFRWKVKSFLGMRTKTLGMLLMGGGITAAFFGALLGDFFLYEIKPLWPWLSHAWLHTQGSVAIVWLLKVALFFGVAQVIMAYVISIYRSVKAGHVHEAIWGEKGLPALIVFVSIVAIAFMFVGMTVIPGVLRIPGVSMGVFTKWPYCLSLAGLMVGLAMMIMGPIVGGEGDISAAGGAVIETLIASISNMLSYIRVAGFCVAHAAFAAVTVTMLKSALMLGIMIGLVFLNFFCLTLEVIVIVIQSMRLTFYEFMTKFYEGDGYRFRPLRI